MEANRLMAIGPPRRRLGETVHQTIFGDAKLGNGGYALLEYLENQDLLFNSIVGPFRVHYGPGRKAFVEK
jgi:hypothetical protein